MFEVNKLSHCQAIELWEHYLEACTPCSVASIPDIKADDIFTM